MTFTREELHIIKLALIDSINDLTTIYGINLSRKRFWEDGEEYRQEAIKNEIIAMDSILEKLKTQS